MTDAMVVLAIAGAGGSIAAMSWTPQPEAKCDNAEDGPLELVIHARERGLADGVSVRRLLPVAARRTVGPFIFFDHLGPLALAPGRGLDVPPHPHIGLATVSYMFEGELLHRDSLGTEQVIRPGDLNWMHAGRGIAHSERSPDNARQHGARVHMLQLWVALPLERENDEPTFQHVPAAAIPEMTAPGARLRIIAGTAWGHTAPVRVASPLFYAEAALEAGAALHLPPEYPERAAYVVEGSVRCGGAMHGPGTMLVFRPGDAALHAAVASRVMLIGGEPLEGPRFIEWNFVASSRERIARAKADWKAGRFSPVPNETDFVPLPD